MDAATSTSAIVVTATVTSFCTVTASALAFGNYSSSQLDASTSVTAICTATTPYTIALDAGIGANATTAMRKMTGLTGGTLNYTLYSDSGRTSVWGDAVGSTVAGTGSGLPQSIPVYGRIAASQSPEPGLYADSVTVTLTY